jgi:hypothetical protein
MVPWPLKNVRKVFRTRPSWTLPRPAGNGLVETIVF